jgi:hypothetical protein
MSKVDGGPNSPFGFYKTLAYVWFIRRTQLIRKPKPTGFRSRQMKCSQLPEKAVLMSRDSTAFFEISWLVTVLATVNGNRMPLRELGSQGLFRNTFSPSLTFLLRKPPLGTMQSLDYHVFCKTCEEPTYREIRYQSDFQFVGRLLVCESCGETILEPVGTGTACQDC